MFGEARNFGSGRYNRVWFVQLMNDTCFRTIDPRSTGHEYFTA